MSVNACEKINGNYVLLLLAFLRLRRKDNQLQNELILVKASWTTDHSIKMNTIIHNCGKNPLCRRMCLVWEGTSKPFLQCPHFTDGNTDSVCGGDLTVVPLGVTQPHDHFQHSWQHAPKHPSLRKLLCAPPTFNEFHSNSIPSFPCLCPQSPLSQTLRRWRTRTPNSGSSSYSIPKGPSEGRCTKVILKLILFGLPFFNVSFGQ